MHDSATIEHTLLPGRQPCEEKNDRRKAAAVSVYNAEMVPWLIVTFLILGLLGLNITFLFAARAIRRDMTKRFDELQRRLESRANAIVDNIFDANQG